MIDWEDPNKVVEVGGGWTVQACDGDAPLLCVERNGLPVGGVEAIAYPISSFDTLDPTADAETNLRRFAEGFVEAIGTDRAAGCGPDYLFQAIPAEPFVLGGAPGIAYGFTGTMPDGRPSELNLQFATTVADHILSIVAIAYDEGGCPGRDDLSGFDSATLTRFRPSPRGHPSPVTLSRLGPLRGSPEIKHWASHSPDQLIAHCPIKVLIGLLHARLRFGSGPKPVFQIVGAPIG